MTRGHGGKFTAAQRGQRQQRVFGEAGGTRPRGRGAPRLARPPAPLALRRGDVSFGFSVAAAGDRHLPTGTGMGTGTAAQQLPSRRGGGRLWEAGGRRAQRGGLSSNTACPLFTAFNNKAVAIATGLINAPDLHN